MRSKVLAPRRGAWIGARTLVVGAIAATISGIGSCGSSGSATVNVTGSQLTIYAAAPAGAPGQQAQDMLDAERLALKGANKVGKYSIGFAALTDPKISNNARAAIEDKTTIAYLGELAPGESANSVGITNGGDVLQVSPSDTAVELTQATAAIPGAPGIYYESHGTYGQTFARVVPNSAREAKAQVQEMQSRGVGSLYVANDGSDYGKAIALAVKNDATAASVRAVQGAPTAAAFKASGAEALFYGAASTARASAFLGNVAEQNAGAKLFVPSALDSSTFASSFGAAKLNLYTSSPGFLPKDLTPPGKQFVDSFTAAYGHAPASEAIFGYEAMKAVLSALQAAGTSVNDRSTVIDKFFAIKNRSSALGTYSIEASGDTTLAPFVFSRLRAGKLVPFASVTVQG